MKPGDADRISEALVLWVGPIPSLCYKREAALSARFGATEAAALEPIVRALEEDFFATDARHVAQICKRCIAWRAPTSSASIPRSRSRPSTAGRQLHFTYK
jgi:hypothetical protein